ncbi:MAG: hypothetical protein MRERC_1c050 [Mycoplasmataceae bacterium RC_NB112A]|nr:MAG: hypothetical protein MRERC_1c050 [Mycoplasmataceae bacterium RC_NB112A]
MVIITKLINSTGSHFPNTEVKDLSDENTRKGKIVRCQPII